MVAVFRTPSHDLSVVVGFARVRPSDRHRVAALILPPAAVFIFRKAAIDFRAQRICGDPFRAVHSSGLDGGRGEPCVDAGFRSVRHTRRCRA